MVSVYVQNCMALEGRKEDIECMYVWTLFILWMVVKTPYVPRNPGGVHQWLHAGG